MVSLQNSVTRSQIGTITGAMNFFRAMMASFAVAAFSAILLMALGADVSLAEGARGSVGSGFTFKKARRASSRWPWSGSLLVVAFAHVVAG